MHDMRGSTSAQPNPDDDKRPGVLCVSLFVVAHHQDWAVGVPYHSLGDAAHKRPPDAAVAPAAHHYQPGSCVLGQGDDFVRHPSLQCTCATVPPADCTSSTASSSISRPLCSDRLSSSSSSIGSSSSAPSG